MALPFKEYNKYTREDFESRLNCGNDLLNEILRKMSENGMAKVVSLTAKGKKDRELASFEIEGAKDISCTINFVGVMAARDCVLRCYPKYISGDGTKKDLQQVMDVIERYYEENSNPDSKRENPMEEVDDSSDEAFSLLALMRWLLLDYYENGIYSNTRDVIEVNGEGEILWDKTINGTIALINKGRPYYMDLLTGRHVSDEYDYCRRLHECILTKISDELKKLELLDLLRLTEVELTDACLEDFGEDEYILYRIERELNTQFNTRKQLLLRNMHDYISRKDTLYDKDGFVFLGVSKFDPVWEKVCAKIMGNQLKKEVKNLLPFRKDVRLDSYYAELAEKVEAEKDENGKSKNKKLKLINLIEKPVWSKLEKTDNDPGVPATAEESSRREEKDKPEEKDNRKKQKNDTLVPDLITIKKINGKWNFIIFDAKYYDADMLADGVRPATLPGIQDITKQYLYQLAYQPFIRAHGFKPGNCFLMPTDRAEVYGGKVSLGMLGKLINQLLGKENVDGMKGLQDIQVRFLPVDEAYKCYLTNRKFDIVALKLDEDTIADDVKQKIPDKE